MIIAEKPDACEHIAKALAERGLKKKTSTHGVDFFEFERDGKKFIAVPAVGHLFNMKAKNSDIPTFDVDWAPSYEIRKGSKFTEKYFKTIEEVSKKCGSFIVACDFDNEGSVIGYNILRYICGVNDAKRMQFSTLAKPDLVKSYENILPHLDWENIEAGLARHELDFYYGINVSRGLTDAVKKFSPRFSLVTAGRVQGPLLCLLAERELEIKRFKPTPYWEVSIALKIGKSAYVADYSQGKIWSEDEAKKLNEMLKKQKYAVVGKITKHVYEQAPPAPFNITSLQTEAYRLFGYTPQQTMQIAQKLYTSAYISYPRTSSEKMPASIGYKDILLALSKNKKYAQICKAILERGELKPVEGKKTDPAHECIHPTVEPPEKPLSGPAAKIYDLICRRFFVAFWGAAKREGVQVKLDVGGKEFTLSGRRTIEKGWIEFYGPYAKFDEIILPEFKEGDKIAIQKVNLVSKETSPPPRYSQAAIIKEMEKRSLGTRATRAAILQTLYDRGYLIDKTIRVTDLGLKVADVLKNHVPDFVDEKLTRKFEKDLEDIFYKRKERKKVLLAARKVVTNIVKQLKENENKIGPKLGKAIVSTLEDRTNLGVCKNCGGTLKILFNPLTKKKFVGCTGYNRCAKCGYSRSACKCKCPICGREKGKCKCSWKDKKWTPVCNVGYPLPANAEIRKTGAVCEKCKTPIVQVIRTGKRPFKMCLDPKCETKADWGRNKPISKKSSKPGNKAAKHEVAAQVPAVPKEK
jgi:DNA topoisomerase-1